MSVKCPDCGNEAQGKVCASCGKMLQSELLSPLPMRGGSEDAGRGGEEPLRTPPSAMPPGESGGPPSSPVPPGELDQSPSSPLPRGEELSGEPLPSSVPRGDEIAEPLPSSVPVGEEPALPTSEEVVPRRDVEEESAGAGVGSDSSGSNWARELGVGGTPTGATGSAASAGTRSASFPGGFDYQVPPQIEKLLTPVERVGKQYLAWIGSLLLFIGVFLDAKTYTASNSVISVSVSRNVWDLSKIWGIILLLLAIASAVIAYVRDYRWLTVTGAIALIGLIINFLFTFSSDVSFFSARPSWGWIVLFPAGIFILAAGLARSTPRDAEDNEGVNKLIGQAREVSARR